MAEPAAAETPLLRDRDFLKYVGARGLSLLGTITTLIALPVLVYRLSGSASLTALVAGLEAAPYLLFGLLAGALSDRWNRRTVTVTADLLAAALLASIPLAHWAGVLTVPHILAVAFLGPTVAVFFDGAVFGAIPMLVGRARRRCCSSTRSPTSSRRLWCAASGDRSRTTAGPGLPSPCARWLPTSARGCATCGATPACAR